MSESHVEHQFHETWLGMVQPAEGLVVSVPVLVEAQCFERQPPDVTAKLAACTRAVGKSDEAPIICLERLLLGLLGYTHENLSTIEPGSFELFVPEGGQVLRPSLAIRPSAAAAPLVLALEIPPGTELDVPEIATGAWLYPASAKFDRLLRHLSVPIGLLCNGAVVRLVYAPAGEATGSISFRLADMLTPSGRPILDALVMLLGANRLFGVAAERSLPRLLEASRRWQANVSDRLAVQVFEAASLLLAGFEDAAVRDANGLLRDAMARGGDHLHRGVLTVLLRLVFLLYAEDAGLMPVEHQVYREGLSVVGLYEELRETAASYPDAMGSRFGAWSRLLSLFRAVFLGVAHGGLRLPARRGALFDPHRFAFLEGWGPAGSAPIAAADERARVSVPSVSDAVVLGVLERLVVLGGQRLSYRSLDVEQIGSVYESILGFTVAVLHSSAVSIRGTQRWVEVEEVLAIPRSQRAKWLKEELGVSGAVAERAGKELLSTDDSKAVLAALRLVATKGVDGLPLERPAGSLVLQPRSSLETTTAHYTPRSLCRPLVSRVLDPIVAALGLQPSAQQLLSLKVCDPAMGSGAFLVEVCRQLADHVVAARRREQISEHSVDGDPVLAARREVAQRCLYGVDRNADAVELAKLSLWLVTLARELPFTFVDHALRHGDSLVGVDLAQIASFHWEPGTQDLELHMEVRGAVAEALPIRSRIEDLASADSVSSQQEKQQLLWDAEDAVSRLRTIADLVVAAFFAETTRAGRHEHLSTFRGHVLAWLRDEAPLPAPVLEQLATLREQLAPFHWEIEFPEIFDPRRADPLERGRRVDARMDAFVGNMPFIGGRRIAAIHTPTYAEWLCDRYQGTGDVDYAAYFFVRAEQYLGASGTIGFIGSNSICQGDTRRCGLQQLLAKGLAVYDARTKVPWPGGANVFVAPVVLAKGEARVSAGAPALNGRTVNVINSRLRAYAERDEPAKLGANNGVSLVGCFLRGDGFVLDTAEAQALLATAPEERAVVHPYLVGDDIAKSPEQLASRWVVDFGVMDLAEGAKYPNALAIVEERVRPNRERLKATGGDAPHRRYWWRFANPRADLRAWLAANDTCLVLPRVAKHLMLARVSTKQVFSEQVVVFSTGSFAAFAVLQSRIHKVWVRLLSSTMGEGLRYSGTDCFDPFPFPQPDPRAADPDLDDIGERLLAARAAYMVKHDVGLTAAYNRLKDRSLEDVELRSLRALHEELDAKVLTAYGWSGIDVPSFARVASEDLVSEAFEDAVLERLFALNGEREAAERVATALTPRPRGAGKKGKKT